METTRLMESNSQAQPPWLPPVPPPLHAPAPAPSPPPPCAPPLPATPTGGTHPGASAESAEEEATRLCEALLDRYV